MLVSGTPSGARHRHKNLWPMMPYATFAAEYIFVWGVGMKIISLIAARRDQDPSHFRQWFLSEHAPDVIEHCPGLRRFIVDLVDTTPKAGVELSDILKGAPPYDNAYDVAAEMWFESVQEYTDQSKRYDSPSAASRIENSLAARVRRTCAYLVDEAYQVLKTHPPIRLGTRSPGIKQIALCLWRMPEPRAREFWREHAARALPYHIGMSKYVQNWVLKDLTPYAQPIHGIGELFWPTDEDFQQRYFSSQEGVELVSRDVQQLQDSASLYTGEYLLKGGEELTGLNVDYLTYRSW